MLILLKIGAVVITMGLAAGGGFFYFAERTGPDPSGHEINAPGAQFLPPTQRPASTPLPVPGQDGCHVEAMAHMPTRNGFAIVDRVIDGDTVAVSQSGRNIRLWGIDAPEHDQPGGLQAMGFLATLLPPGALVKTQDAGEDQYGRLLAVVGQEGQPAVNFRMVYAGWAFVYTAYGDRNPCLEAAEKSARLDKRGLWGMYQNGGIRPWEWRKNNP